MAGGYLAGFPELLRRGKVVYCPLWQVLPSAIYKGKILAMELQVPGFCNLNFIRLANREAFFLVEVVIIRRDQPGGCVYGVELHMLSFTIWKGVALSLIKSITSVSRKMRNFTTSS